MSIMDSHPHPSLGRGNAAGSTLFDHEPTAKTSVIVNASTVSTNIENANQSPSTSHSQHQHQHHQHHPHHQFVDSSSVYHHPFRTITPNPAESAHKILDPQPPSKSSTPTNQPQTQSRPNSGSTSDWSTSGIVPSPAPLVAANRRPFSSSSNLESSVPREQSSTSGGVGTGYPSPTATPASRRSSCNPHLNPSPSQADLLPSAQASTTTPAPSYYQQHSGPEHANLAMIAAIDCGGLDVRPIYGSEDSRHPSVSNSTQPHSDNHTHTHTRVSNAEDVRGPYYAQPPSAPYNSINSGMLPSHYPHLASPMTPQAVPRRQANSTTSGATYSPYSNLTGQVPLGPSPYGHHHPHHPEASVVPSGWTPSVDSVRDSVSPYTRPHRQPSGPLSAHHTSPSTSFTHSMRNGQLLSTQHHSNSSTAQHHQPGTIQYNAQGRPLSYICTTCLRAFDRPSALQIHERSHTGERPFPCPWNGCVKRFTTHGNMVKHSRVCPFREPED